MKSQPMFSFYEFFAGGGMARAGLGDGWHCSFANDFDEMKAATYRANWGGEHFLCDDVAKLTTSNLPGTADLAWASFPCQDLSLAGVYKGLGKASSAKKTRSGTFWLFKKLMEGLSSERRSPRLIVLENVYGTLTSHKGRDFSAIGAALTEVGYRFGALVVNARDFVPQSRPRVFFIAVRADVEVPEFLIGNGPQSGWHPAALVAAHEGLSTRSKSNWIWWKLATPAVRNTVFADLIEEVPEGVDWHTPAETRRLISMMSAINKAKVEKAKRQGKLVVGCIYRRTRPDEQGRKIQRAEIRFDDIAGCLRTPAGGSSRQTILIVEGRTIKSRLLSPREAARLMGLDDSFKLPQRYNDAYHVAGDGVCAPVVRHIAAHLLEPILSVNGLDSAQIAA